MKIPTVIALALFASSASSAGPRDEGSEAVPVERVQPSGGRWVNLALPIPTRHGTEWITVGPQAGTFRSLRIDAVSGTVKVRSIRVELSDGRMTTYYLSRTLDRHHPHTYVELNTARSIDNIVIVTARRPVGTYAVFGAQGVAHEQNLVARVQ